MSHGRTSRQDHALSSHIKDLVFEKQIGKGSYGEVYQAVWKGRTVAAKRIHSVFFNNGFHDKELRDHYVNEFRREWEVLRLLHHPNIVEMYTVLYPVDLSPVIITELLHCDLEKHISESTLSPKIPLMKLLCIASDVIKGLQHMHGLSPPVVHRDLATKNILLTVDGQAKIADLGVAKVFAAGKEMVATNVPGTPLYAAPETYPLLKGFEVVEGAKYGPKVDIFSFGAVVMAMVVGHEPRVWPLSPITKGGEKLSEHVRRKGDITEMGDSILKGLVLACLENDSEMRPSADDITVELEKNKWDIVHCDEASLADEEVEFERVDSQPRYDYKFKVLFLGNMGVGKSCLMRRFQNPSYVVQMSTTTLGLDIDNENVRCGSKFVHLQLVDTAGQEQFHSMQAMYCHGIHGIFLVCDVTRPETFDNIAYWVNYAQLHCTVSNVLIMLVGNKIDQVQKRQISYQEGEAIAKRHKLSYMETSALDVATIESMYKAMTQLLIRSVDVGAIEVEVPNKGERVELKEVKQKSKCRCRRT